MAITIDFGKCDQCGAKNSHFLTKCHACGSALPWAPIATPAPPSSTTPAGGVGPGSNKGFCPHCGAATVGIVNYCASCGKAIFSSSGKRASNRNTSSGSGSSFLSFVGGLMLLGGVLAACYFLFLFDTSVAVPTTEFMGVSVGGGRVNNIGLMADRQNGIIFSLGIAVLGMFLMFLGRSQD